MYISEINSIKNYLISQIYRYYSILISISSLVKNNLGKTNILELIHCFFTVGKFPKDDFQNKLQPIEISVVVKYSDAEIGFLRITLM